MFSYDPSSSLKLNRIRFYLGDTELDRGVLPGGANFQDEEITNIISESQDDIGYSLYNLARTTSSKWASAPQSFVADGLRINRGDTSKKWLEMARQFDKDFNVIARFGYIGLRTFDLLREDRDVTLDDV